MENLSAHDLPAVMVLAGLVLAFGLAAFLKSWNLLVQRKAARAMKRGNEIYLKWRHDTVRQPLK